MKTLNRTGAAGALLVLLLGCGDADNADSSPADAERTASATTAAATKVAAAATAATAAKVDGHDRDAAEPAHTAADGHDHGTAQGEPVEEASSQRLRPGLERLATGVDLSQVPAGDADVEPMAEAPARPDPSSVERQGTYLGGQGPVTVAQDETGEIPAGHATVLGADRHDFGSLVQGTHASHTFRLKSDGENDLVITRIKPSCGCTVASVSLVGENGASTNYVTGSGIPPGTEFEIEAAFKSDGKQGRTKTQIALYCNDPRTVLSLMLEAEVQPVLLLEPRTLNLGNVTSTDQVKGTIRLTSSILEPFVLSVDGQFVQKSMGVELEAIEPDAEGRAREWDVHVTLGPDLPEGVRNYPIRLLTDEPIPSSRVDDGHGHDITKNYFVIGYAQVTVKGLVSASPAYVPFGMVRPGAVVERVVRIDCHDDFQLSADAPVEMTALIQKDVFDYAKSFSTSLEPVEGQNALDLTVRLEGLPDDASGSFGGMLRVMIDHPNKKEVMVRFSGVSRPGVPPQGSQGQGSQ